MLVVKNLHAVAQPGERSSARPTQVNGDAGSIASCGNGSSKLDSNQSDGDELSHSSPSSAASSPSSTTRDGITVSSQERGISLARLFFLLFILLSAAALATAVYFITLNGESDDFTVSFQTSASEVFEATNDNISNIIGTLESLSLTTTTYILQEQLVQQNNIPNNHNSTFPPGFVTIPNTEHQLGRAREATQAYMLGYVPTVMGKDYEKWNEYVDINKGWMEEAFKVDSTRKNIQEVNKLESSENVTLVPFIWSSQALDENGNKIVQDFSICGNKQKVVPTSIERIPEKPKDGPAPPIWLLSPPPNPKLPNRENFNMRSNPSFQLAVDDIAEKRRPAFLDICSATEWFDPSAYSESVDSLVVVPVFGSFEDNATIVGHLFAVVPWSTYFLNELPTGTDPVSAVVTSSCGHTFTYEIEGHDATLLDENDVHDPAYDAMGVASPLAEFASVICQFTLTVYPTAEYEATYTSQDPIYFMLIILFIFIGTSMCFLLFDCMVQKRQQTLVTTARKQSALVSSLFPKSIQKKLMAELGEQEDLTDASKLKSKWNKSGTAGLRSYLNADGVVDRSEGMGGVQSNDKSKPIADLFPETTIMFADIAGFTAWSSTREPSQVFTLLEAIYHEFDMIAKRRRVFKVEVVGDCYVAVCGLPDPRRDHAVVMAKFARDCLAMMYPITRKLEVELGPDTADLGLRVGIHSGPVVAGVLRGDKSRFQLFGDTMNTTARIETTGIPGRIHVSQDTANLLIAAGKEKWVTLRENKVEAKGKGELTTYWLIDSSTKSRYSASTTESIVDGSLDDEALFVDQAAQEEKRNRVAEWTVEVLSSVLRTIIRSRNARKVRKDPTSKLEELERQSLSNSGDTTVIHEVAAQIILPDYKIDDKLQDEPEVVLDRKVTEELRNYVQTIAGLYKENPFHNFDHANHVVMSVNKLLSRINAPDLDANNEELHDHTYGINSDPLTWFAVAFAALIHDVDHSGVPNSQLVKEGAIVAELYGNKSVAEQNSFDISWDLLMEPMYKNLRDAIYVTADEFRRFRQLVINTVMATDIIDKDLKRMQNVRWEAAFDGTLVDDEGSRRIETLKATIVIEHLIQASDVSHTMQHWHVYRRWNEKFFLECYHAYMQGRAGQNPAITWYEGEKGFFDFYIIPLAKKLKECGVFGVSSDEYLSYATQNRQEWEERGREIVDKMVKKAEAFYGANPGKGNGSGSGTAADS